MYLLTFIQNGRETLLALFDTLESGREFAAGLPGYRIWQEEVEGETYVYESLRPEELPDYMAAEHRGNLIPLSRFMFPDEEEVDIIWRELVNMDVPDGGMAQGATLVDAYMINNEDAEAYITAREANYRRVSRLLAEMGYEADRCYRGSEDGEAMIVRKKGEPDWHFLSHMDPFFAEDLPEKDTELAGWIKAQL